ncbi:MAG: transcriptional regulator [Candidatus Thiodiazotropha sp. (ex Lucinoma borealis)]|nr:transcriptional regulator [Candidatus Thiodiazotropha sp. (ex Lucinoma borealis)]
MTIKLIRNSELIHRRGKSKSSHYEDIALGLFVPPIQIGDRAVATPEHELEQMLNAQISGATKDELRTIVKKILADRKGVRQ